MKPVERTPEQTLEFLLEVRAVKAWRLVDGGFVVTTLDRREHTLTADGVVAFHRGVLLGWRLPRDRAGAA